MKSGDYAAAGRYLNNIIALRDCFLENDIMPSFTYSMNLIGYEGDFSQDYMPAITEAAKTNVKAEMIRIGEIPAYSTDNLLLKE